MQNHAIRENLSQDGGGQPIIISYDQQVDEFPLHWHTYVEILYVIQGELTITVSDKTYTLSDNQILFIQPGELHKIHPNNRPLTICLQYDPLLISHITSLHEAHYINAHIRLVSASSEPSLFFQLSSSIMNIQKLASGIGSSNDKKQPDHFTDARMAILLIEFLIHLSEHEIWIAQKNTSELASLPAETIQSMMDACAYIARNCTADLTLEEVAAHAGFSKYYFSRMFKKYTGNSFVDYLATCRITQAKTLLSDPKINISDIAMQAGFGSIASFNRVFQKSEGCSPSEFRSMLSF